MMNQYLDIEQLQQSIPLYVAVFKQDNFVSNLVDVAKAEYLGIENADSLFKHIQTFPIELQKDTLLASAAIPILFESHKDSDGSVLTDGGQGGWIKCQGNTPITPLVQAGCDYVIVSHLNNGSLWHRHDFPQTSCIEIRPNPQLDLGYTAMFDFSKQKIEQLKKAGYEDTMSHLSEIKEMLACVSTKRTAMNRLDQSLQQTNQSQAKLDDAMERLRQGK